MKTIKKMIQTRLSHLSDENILLAMNTIKGKKLTQEQKIKFSNHYTKKINSYEKK